MPTFDVESERVNVFLVGESYLFRHYFDREYVFDALSEFYVPDEYRFEVPAAKFDAVQDVLSDTLVEPVIVEDLEPFCVITERYDPHANILRNAVLHWERRGHLFFILKDELAVRQAIEGGAQPVEETEFVLGI